jgi:hypothetical protein
MTKLHYLNLLTALVLLFGMPSCSKDANGDKGKPSTVKITRITINSYPITNGAVPWDDPFLGSATGPDVTWVINGPENFGASVYFADCSGDTLITTTDFPIYMQNPENAHTISLWDKDDLDGSDLGSVDDLMASISFTPWRQEGDEEKDALILNTSTAEIILDVTFLYE